MDGELISVNEEQKWRDALGRTGCSDVYLSSKYHRLSEIDTGRSAYAFFNEVDGHFLFHPFLLDQVPPHLAAEEIFYDIESCYGYGGPVSSTEDPLLLKRLWAPYLDWCQKKRVIAEFTRFHPLLTNSRFSNAFTKTIRISQTVYIDVSKDEAAQWANYPPSSRTTIRQASEKGLAIRMGSPDEIKRLFLPLYRSTMDFLKASSRYYFSEAYFDYLEKEAAAFCDVLFIEKEGKAIASGIFLQGEPFYHYHLGCSSPDFRDCRPNNLLLHGAALVAHSKGFCKMHLGGGRSHAPEDSLFKFKASFSRARADFYIGESVYIPKAYEAVSSAWLEANPTATPSPVLLFYRKSIPSPG